MEFAGAHNKMFKFQNILAIILLAGSAALAITIATSNNKTANPQAEANISVNPKELPPIIDPNDSNEVINPQLSKISQRISEEIIKLNPDGPSLLDGQQRINALEPDKLVQKVLNSELGNINYPDLSPSIEIAALKIVKTSDKIVWENYLKNFRAILTNNFSSLKVNLKNPTAKDFEALVGAYEKTLAQFYSLNAPEILAEVHKEEIRLMTAQQNIFASLANYEQDPLKAFVAGKMIGGIQNQFAVLNKKVTEFISENSLKI